MIKNKKILAILLATTLAFAATACGNTENEASVDTSVSSINEAKSNNEADINASVSADENDSNNQAEAEVHEDSSDDTSSLDENTDDASSDNKAVSNGVGLTKNDVAFAACEEEYNETISKIIDMVLKETEFTYIPGSYGLSECTISFDKDEFLDGVGYTFLDLNSDGDYELLIGEVGDKIIRACYTDGDLFLFDGWARNSMKLIPETIEGKDCYKIFNMGSGGAASTSYGLIQLNSENKLIWDEFYFTDTKADGETGVFTNGTGKFDINFADEIDMPEDDVHDMGSKWDDETIAINFTPLSAFPYEAESNDKNSDSAVLKATYLYDSEKLADIKLSTFGDGLEGGYRSVIADSNYEAVSVIIIPSMDLEDVSFINYKNLEVDESGETISFEKEIVDKEMTFKAGEPIMVTMTFYGDIPNYGFTGKSGDKVYYTMIGLSGEDGSPMLFVYGQN